MDVPQITIMQQAAQIQKSVLRDSRAIVAFLLRDRGLGEEPYAEKKSSTPKKCPLPSLLVARLRAPPPPSSHHASVAFGQQLLAPDPMKIHAAATTGTSRSGEGGVYICTEKRSTGQQHAGRRRSSSSRFLGRRGVRGSKQKCIMQLNNK